MEHGRWDAGMIMGRPLMRETKKSDAVFAAIRAVLGMGGLLSSP
jgi:hypothetical protein